MMDASFAGAGRVPVLPACFPAAVGSGGGSEMSPAAVRSRTMFPRQWERRNEVFPVITTLPRQSLGGCSQAVRSSGAVNDWMRRNTVDGTPISGGSAEDGTIIPVPSQSPFVTTYHHTAGRENYRCRNWLRNYRLSGRKNDSGLLPKLNPSTLFPGTALKQVWNKTIGLLDLRDVQRINWYAPEDVTGRRNDGIYTVRNAVPIKHGSFPGLLPGRDTLVPAVLMRTIRKWPRGCCRRSALKNRAGFASSGDAGLYPDDLTLIKGEGDDAISIVTQCRPAPEVNMWWPRNPTGRAMVVHGYYTDTQWKNSSTFTPAWPERIMPCCAPRKRGVPAPYVWGCLSPGRKGTEHRWKGRGRMNTAK